MATALLSYAGWTFLPGLVSGWVQTVYYGVTIRAGDPKPQPGTPRYLKHRARIQTVVIIIYLLYTVYEADYILRQEGDFYQTLGVPLDADEKKIKSKFRRLAAIHHPDKLTTDDPFQRAKADTLFHSLKTAQDTLSDPIKRFAYERFGPSYEEWQHCVTMRDYVTRGSQLTQAPIYGASFVVMLILSFTTYLQGGRYWRYLFFGILVTLEMHTVTRPYHTPILVKFVNPLLEWGCKHPPLLPYQLLILARKATFTLFLAFSQLGALFAKPGVPSPANNGDKMDLVQLARLEQIAMNNDQEAARLLALDMAPFVQDGEPAVKELRGRIRDWLVNNTIRSDPEVRDAMGKVMKRRRAGAPPGARIG